MKGMYSIHGDIGDVAQISSIVNHRKYMLVLLGLNSVLQESKLVERILPRLERSQGLSEKSSLPFLALCLLDVFSSLYSTQTGIPYICGEK